MSRSRSCLLIHYTNIMHKEARRFFAWCLTHFGSWIHGNAVEVGSLNVNGSLRDSIEPMVDSFTGIDVVEGKGVDLIGPAHTQDSIPDESVQVVISSESLEHDKHWKETLLKEFRMLAPGGIMMFSCASTGRPEHGTRRTSPHCSGTAALDDEEWQDYYGNRVPADFFEVADIDSIFSFYKFMVNTRSHDMYFVGIRNGGDEEALAPLFADTSLPRGGASKGFAIDRVKPAPAAAE
jgi:hypothetical protein